MKPQLWETTKRTKKELKATDIKYQFQGQYSISKHCFKLDHYCIGGNLTTRETEFLKNIYKKILQ